MSDPAFDDLRQQWQAFIVSSGHAGRFLYSSGDASITAAAGFSEQEARRFLNKLADAEAGTSLLARIYYLTQPRVARFFFEVLPSLTRAMSHSTSGVLESSRRGIRGKVHWAGTLRARAAGRADSATYLLRRVERSADIPENQLIRLFLEEVSRAIAETTATVGTGSMVRELDEIRRAAEVALKSPYMQGVSRPQRASTLMRQRAARNRNRQYREVTELQQELDAAVRESKWETVLRLLARGWLAPVDTDDLFELYILVLVMDILQHEMGFGPPNQYGLIRARRREVARFRRVEDDTRADVYFDQGPSAVLGRGSGFISEYVSLSTSYEGFTVSERRPDILVRFHLPGGGERRVLVEIKETADERYKRDSVYKAMAYLRDFSRLWDTAPAQSPRAILVFPQQITLKTGANDAGRDLVFSAASDRPRLTALLASAMAY